jgi:aspartate 1-decarboxylase
MLKWMCTCKIKSGKVTDTQLHYEGSITLDADIIEAAGLLTGEMVYVLNLSNGARINTYVIEGQRATGVICLNGAAARLFEIGDEIIILATSWMQDEEAKSSSMKMVELDDKNRVKKEG